MVSGSQLISYAKQFIGVPYVWGGTSPSGFDCSGLVKYVYGHFGINLSRTTKTQINEGREVSRNELQLGDLVFPSSGHVTLYVGNNQVLHAPQPGERVKISNIWSFWRARRILSDEVPVRSQQNIQNDVIQKKYAPVGEFTLHTGTCLHKTGDSFEFLVGNGNVYCISKNGTGSKTTEVHVLNGGNNFQNFILQTKTALHETDGNWQFLLGDYNHDGVLDLYCICKRNTGTHTTEVHVLSGRNNFQSFLLHTGTKLHETDGNWKFGLGDFNGDGCLDLYCIAKVNTGSGTTEVHILGGRGNFQQFIMQTGTCLHQTNENWDFCVYGKNVYCIGKQGTGSHSTEVHVLNGYNNFKNFVLQTGTKLHETGNSFSFYVFNNKLYAFSKQGASNSTEVHCLQL